MPDEPGHVWAEFLEQGLSPRLGEGGGDADVLKRAGLVVEPEQKRAWQRPVDEAAKTRDDAVRRALLFDLHHRSCARFVFEVAVLGDDAVDPTTLIATQPAAGFLDVSGNRCQKQRRPGPAHQFCEQTAPLLKRPVAYISIGVREQV